MARTNRAPWLKWYPTDWRADPRLRMCSLAARGLWIEMLGFMHEAESYGSLFVGGIVPSIDELAVLVGAPVAAVTELLAELESRGVFSRDEDGVIYSRRMVRDQQKAARNQENGKTGGNPRLKGGGVNPEVNPEVKAQRPEARESPPSSNTESVAAREAGDSNVEGNPVGAARPHPPDPSKSPALKATIKQQLIQKLIRYVNARCSPEDRQHAIEGLLASDPVEAQRWLDDLDARMRAEGWDDMREWKKGQNIRRVA